MRQVAVLLLAVALFLMPAPGSAASGHGGHGSWGRGGGGHWGHGFHGHGFPGHGFHGHGFVVVGPGCCWGGPWWWGYPPYYYPPQVAYYSPPYSYPPSYYGPPASYGPPVRYAAPSATVSVAPARPTPNVVQFATGRYELRGDGVSVAYAWVWIPNPPTAPPQAALPSTPSGAPRVSPVYRWIDEQGVAHATDRLGAVPERYRSQVKQPPGPLI